MMFVSIIKRFVAGALCACISLAAFCYDAAVAGVKDDGAIVINSQEDLEKLYGNDNIYFEDVEFSDDEDDVCYDEDALCKTEDTAALPRVYAANATEGDADAKAINPEVGGVSVKATATYNDGASIPSTTIKANTTWTINGTVTITGKITVESGYKLAIIGGTGVKYEGLYNNNAVVRIVTSVDSGDATFYVKEGGQLVIKAEETDADSFSAGYYDRVFITASGGNYHSTVPIIRCANSSSGTTGTVLKLIGVDLRNNANTGTVYGGAISLNGDFTTLQIRNSQVYRCAAVQGGAVTFHNEFRMASGTALFEKFNAYYCYAAECGGAIMIRQGANGGDDSNLLINKLTFKNCKFTECYAGTRGGAIYINGSTDGTKGTRINEGLTIEDCTFNTCVAGLKAEYTKEDKSPGWDGMTFTETKSEDCGGGAVFFNCRIYLADIKNSTFTNCSSPTGGNALHFHSSYVGNTTNITNCTFDSCQSSEVTLNSGVDDNGGTIRTVGATSTVMNLTGCTFTNNYSRDNGGALYWNAAGIYVGSHFIVNSSVCKINGCTFNGNWSATDGGAIFCEAVIEITGVNKFLNNKAGYKKNGAASTLGRGGAILQKVYQGSARTIGANETTKLTLSSETVIHNNVALTYGGGVGIIANWSSRFESLNAVKTHTVRFELGGAEIYNNSAKLGGGIYFNTDTATPSNYATVTYYGSPALYTKEIMLNTGSIHNNTAEQYGGGVYMNGETSKIEISSADIYENTATGTRAFGTTTGIIGSGGGIYLTGKNSEIYVYGGRVYNNTAGSFDTNMKGLTVGNGGGIYITGESATVYLKPTEGTAGGQIYSNVSSQNGAGIYVSGATATCDMTGGVIGGVQTDESGNPVSDANGNVIPRPNVAHDDGGGIFLYKSTLNFSGGNIDYNEATDGGGVYLFSTAEATIKGSSSIAYNKASISGGGVYCKADEQATAGPKITITNGAVNNNTCATVGGGVRINGGTINLEGGTVAYNVTTGNGVDSCGGGIYANTVEDTVGDLATVVKITGGTLYGNRSDGNGGGIYIGRLTTLTMEKGSIGLLDSNGNKIGNSAGVLNDDGSVKVNGAGGGVYATGGATVTISGGYVGYNTATLHGGGLFVTSSATLEFSDGDIYHNSSSNNGGGVGVFNGGTLTLDGGNITDNTAKNRGGGVYIHYSANSTATTPNPTITVNGGNIARNTATNGGGIYALKKEITGSTTVLRPTVTINGGNIGGETDEDGNSASYGGGVYIDGAKFALNASASATGSISNNTASEDGGGAYIINTVDAISITGDISDNTAGNNGGGAYITDTTALVSIGGNAENNVAYGNGGGLYLKNSKVSLAGNLIGNTSTTVTVMETDGESDIGHGGGAFVSGSSAEFTIATGGSVSGNSTDGNGGGIAAFDGATVNLNGGVVGGKDEGNSAVYGYGGGVYASNATVNIAGSDVCYNTAKNGGGVCATDGGELVMTGGFLRYNKALGKPDSTVTTSHEKDEELAGVGGGVYLSDGVNANMSTYELTGSSGFGIYGNTAEWAADDVFANSVYTKLTLPSALDMTLADTEFSRATGWFEDYNNGDTRYAYGLKGDVNVGGRRYKETERTVIAYINATDAAGDTDASTVYINDDNTYVCLTLGTAKAGYGEITISKKGDDIDPTQVFVFRISGTTLEGKNISFYATVTGASTVRITDVPDGTYTVTEIVDWAWRYELESITVDNGKNQSEVKISLDELYGTVKINSGDTSPDIEFKNKLTRDKWLGSNSDIEKNVAGSSTANADANGSFVVYLEQPKKKEPVATAEDEI